MGTATHPFFPATDATCLLIATLLNAEKRIDFFPLQFQPQGIKGYDGRKPDIADHYTFKLFHRCMGGFIFGHQNTKRKQILMS